MINFQNINGIKGSEIFEGMRNVSCVVLRRKMQQEKTGRQKDMTGD